MGIKYIDVVHLESFEAFFEAFLNVLSVCGSRRVHIRIFGDMNFSGYDNMLPGSFEIFKDLSQLDFGVTSIINFSSVELVDAILEGNLDDLFVLFIVFGLDVDHVSERDGRYLESTVAKVVVDHLSGLEHRHIFQLV